jgi:hypothetical protein
MFRMMVSVAEIQIAQINRKRKNRAQDSDRIVPVEAEIDEEQKGAEGAAFPKTNRNNAFARALRGDPLNDEAGAENQIAGPAEYFPAIDGKAERAHVREKLKMLHGTNVREEHGHRRVFSSGHNFA